MGCNFVKIKENVMIIDLICTYRIAKNAPLTKSPGLQDQIDSPSKRTDQLVLSD